MIFNMLKIEENKIASQGKNWCIYRPYFNILFLPHHFLGPKEKTSGAQKKWWQWLLALRMHKTSGGKTMAFPAPCDPDTEPRNKRLKENFLSCPASWYFLWTTTIQLAKYITNNERIQFIHINLILSQSILFLQWTQSTVRKYMCVYTHTHTYKYLKL